MDKGFYAIVKPEGSIRVVNFLLILNIDKLDTIIANNLNHMPISPKTKHQISDTEFINAVEGSSFRETDWFYRKKGKEIRQYKMFSDTFLEDDRYYIVLVETTCFSLSGYHIQLEGLEDSNYKPAFIFVNCVIPGLFLTNGQTDDLVFIHTYVKHGIQIDDNSRVGCIRIEDRSSIGDIFIREGAACEDISIIENSIATNIVIFNNAKCGDIGVGTHSQCNDITIDQGSLCGSIYLRVKSSIGNIRIENASQIGSISVENRCQIGDINVLVKSKYEDISVEQYSQCKNILIEDNSEGDEIRIYDNSQCEGLDLNRMGKCKNVTIKKGSQSKDIRLDNESQSGNINVEGGSQCGNIHIWGESSSGYIWIYKGSLCQVLHLDDSSQCGFISIDNSQCKGIGIYSNSKAESINVVHESRAGVIVISGNGEIDMLKIHRGSKSGGVRIDEGKVNKVKIEDDFCSIILRSATISVMQINNCYLNQLIWESGTKVELYIDGCTVNHLQLYKTSLLKDAIVSIINSKIHIIQLQELLAQGQLVLRNIEVASRPFVGLQRAGNVVENQSPGKDQSKLEMVIDAAGKDLIKRHTINYHKQLKVLYDNPAIKGHTKPLFRIVSSSLGKTEITGSDLTGFNFEYRDSKLLEVFINGTQLPKEKIDIYNEAPESGLPDQVYFEQKVSIYNQLKRIFENQGDIVEATWYHSKAMANQQRLLSLRYNKKEGEPPGKWWSEEAFDLFNFWLNKVSNNHGESWRRALCFSFVVLLFIYTGYFTCISWDKPFALSGSGAFIGNFFSFLDITHKIDFMVEKEELNWGAKVLDFFGRAATGYCIYQFVAAFRRHGKK